MIIELHAVDGLPCWINTSYIRSMWMYDGHTCISLGGKDETITRETPQEILEMIVPQDCDYNPDWNDLCKTEQAGFGPDEII